MLKSFCLTMLIACALAHSGFALAADPVAIRQQLIDATIRGDVAGAVALYADNAVVDGTPACYLAPCIGKSAIQRDIQGRVNAKNRATPLNNYVSGNVLTTRSQVQSDATKKAGVDRLIVWIIYELKDNKIASERVFFDRTDPQTVRFLEWLVLQY